MENILQEVFESDLILEEAKDRNVLGTIIVTAGKADWENANKRIYPKAVFDDAVLEFNKAIKAKNTIGIIGNLDHSQEAYPELSKASHLIRRLWMDGDLLKMEAQLLNTSKGKDALTVLKSGAKIGVSLKGFGEIKDKKVQPGYKIASVDIVNQPSFGTHAELSLNNLFESVNSFIEKNDKDEILYQKYIRDCVGSGSKLTFRDYKKIMTEE